MWGSETVRLCVRTCIAGHWICILQEEEGGREGVTVSPAWACAVDGRTLQRRRGLDGSPRASVIAMALTLDDASFRINEQRAHPTKRLRVTSPPSSSPIPHPRLPSPNASDSRAHVQFNHLLRSLPIASVIPSPKVVILSIWHSRNQASHPDRLPPPRSEERERERGGR
jgi:hypothetical protein